MCAGGKIYSESWNEGLGEEEKGFVAVLACRVSLRVPGRKEHRY